MINLDQSGDIAVLTLDHGKVNAVDVELLTAIAEQLAALAGQPGEAPPVIITGAGRAFSAGVDLVRFLDDGPDYGRRLVPAISGAVTAVLEYPAPVVAAVNGAAIAGGCVLACACDYRVVARSAPIGATELDVGVPFPTAALEVVREAAGTNAPHVVYGAGIVKGDDAIAAGFADELADDDAVLAAARAAAARLHSIPPATFRLTKEQLRAPVLERIAAGRRQDVAVAEVWASDETAAIVRAFVKGSFGRPR